MVSGGTFHTGGGTGEHGLTSLKRRKTFNVSIISVSTLIIVTTILPVVNETKITIIIPSEHPQRAGEEGRAREAKAVKVDGKNVKLRI